MDPTEAQWKRIELLLPKPRLRPDGRGRPWRDPRDVLNGVLWVMRTGAPILSPLEDRMALRVAPELPRLVTRYERHVEEWCESKPHGNPQELGPHADSGAGSRQPKLRARVRNGN